jgi:hypothetical protein
MSKVIYDVIQRFELENGVPRLISTNIQVIEGGDDLTSLAIRILTDLGFDRNFEKKQRSQYIGYRAKDPQKGAKNYRLILMPRKEGLSVSIHQAILEPHLLELAYWINMSDADAGVGWTTSSRIWVKPSSKESFLNKLNVELLATIDDQLEDNQLENRLAGRVYLNKVEPASPIYDEYRVIQGSEIIPKHEFNAENLSDRKSYLVFFEDKLFPYTWQVSINSTEILEEFLNYFGSILIRN